MQNTMVRGRGMVSWGKKIKIKELGGKNEKWERKERGGKLH